MTILEENHHSLILVEHDPLLCEDAREMTEYVSLALRKAAKEAAVLLYAPGTEARPRLEDLSVFKVRKANKNGKEHEYWHAAWIVEEKTRNVYLGSRKHMSREEALAKARAKKAEELGIGDSRTF
jgi:hypothetical protein